MVQSEVHSENPKATIKSLPLELDFMIIEWLTLEDALNMAKALLIPKQVAVQYFAFEKERRRRSISFIGLLFSKDCTSFLSIGNHWWRHV